MSNESDPKPAESTPETPEEPVASASPTKRRMRWVFPLMVVLLAPIGQAIAIYAADYDYSMSYLFGVPIWSTATALLFGWWLFFSGLQWKTRLTGVGVLALAGVVFVTLFRVNGIGGNFLPRFEYRFAPHPEDVAREYFESASSTTQANGLESAATGNSTEARIEVTDADWPRFGGPRFNQVVDETINRDWDAHPPKQLWRHPVGPAWSSFAVVGDLAFTQEQRGDNEGVVCYDANTGAQLWLHEDPTRFYEAASGVGPRGTPTIHDSRLYSLGATGILNCLDPLSGSVFWSRDIVSDANTEVVEYGVSGSPLIYEELVIVTPGGSNGAVTAYDRMTGEKQWAGGQHKAAGSVELKGQSSDDLIKKGAKRRLHFIIYRMI